MPIGRVDIHLFHHFLPIPALLNSPMWVLEEGLKRELLSAEVLETVFLFFSPSSSFAKMKAHLK